MKATTIMQLQSGDVLGMIASHLSKKYGKKVTKVTPQYKVESISDQLPDVQRTLSHFEVSFEDEISDTFGE